MRPLNGRQAVECENATTQRCTCRCGGALHGSRRSELREFFEQLEQDDPHWLVAKSRQLPLPPPVGVAA